MIIEVKEITFHGFLIQHAENKGWQIVLNEDVRILFSTFQDAQAAVNDFYKDIVPKHRGKKVKMI